MILGMDFGTTNSGMAVYDGRTLRPLPLDPASPGGMMDRTALYLTHDHRIATGQRAIDRYLEQNIGRPVKMERVRVGTISVTAAEIGTYYRDVHIQRDVLAPGRLFTSFKTFLASTSYEGTVVGGLRYALDDIVAAYLRVAKLRAEERLNRELSAVVLGRPVAFARDPAADRLAQDRLVGAALRAGFATVYLQLEPVAAALQFETSLQRERIVLVFDFGGGTLDVTVMRIGDPRTRAVLATGGIPVAGDVFDQRIVRRKLARLFGEGSMYGPPGRRVPVPTWVYDALADWQEIVSLQQPENRAVLDEMLASAEQPQALRHLIELASKNYGLALYTAVEQAKRRLSEVDETTIHFDAASFALREPLGRREFELLIDDEARAVDLLLVEVVRAAGLAPAAIDAVVCTGGSSRIPLFVRMLQRLFGAEKVRDLDIFSSVTAGLAVAAQRIEAGELEATAYDHDPRGDGAALTEAAGEARGPAVEAAFLTAWITAQEQAATAPNPHAAVTWITAEYQLRTRELPTPPSEGAAPLDLNGGEIEAVRPNQAVVTGLDDPLALLTSAYRILLATPRQLGVLERNALALSHIHDFEHGEVICALAPWDDARTHDQLAVLSSRGVLRVVEMEQVRRRLDRSIPFRLEAPPESDPVALAGLRRDQQLALVTSAGRAVRLAPPSTASRAFAAIKRVKEERIVGCVPLCEDGLLLLVAPDGTARLLVAEQMPLVTEPRTQGAVVARRLDVCCVARVAPSMPLWALTSQRLCPMALAQPSSGGVGEGLWTAGRPFQLLRLEGEERVRALVMDPNTSLHASNGVS